MFISLLLSPRSRIDPSPPTRSVQAFRRSLPEGSALFVAKNSLMTQAVKDKEAWGPLAAQDRENAWLFVGESISPTIKVKPGDADICTSK